MKIKSLLAVALIVCIGLGVYYADLLEAAFLFNPVPRTANSIARGRRLFQQNCAVCHGTEGRGDGVAAASLPVRPDDLSTIARPPIFPDGIVAYRIRNGVKIMPAFKATLSEDDTWDLINFIRSLSSNANITRLLQPTIAQGRKHRRGSASAWRASESAADNYERPCTSLTLAPLVLTTIAVFPCTVVAPE